MCVIKITDLEGFMTNNRSQWYLVGGVLSLALMSCCELYCTIQNKTKHSKMENQEGVHTYTFLIFHFAVIEYVCIVICAKLQLLN